MNNVLAFSEGRKEQLDLLGGKGANLAEMTRLRLPVPDGFTITTEACLTYLKEKTLSSILIEQVNQKIKSMEQKAGKRLGDKKAPLLVSVRSGSKFSMPGMMDTILNLGLNDETVIGLAEKTRNGRFAYDCYRRLIQMFGDVVYGINKNYFEDQLTEYKEMKKYILDTEMTEKDWKEMIALYKDVFIEVKKEAFPQDPFQQLYLSIEAVFRSWNNRRAVTYRRLNNISDTLGTAVNIQEMVFGNFGNESGTGVAFTRNPVTGEKGIFGEFLLNAQGEDVVAGIRTPQSIKELQRLMPEVYQEFLKLSLLLEKHYKDMQDIEFTIENRQLYLLQTRTGKRTAKASIKICIDLVAEGVISKNEALKRLTPAMISQLLHPVFEPTALQQACSFATGLPASPGAASGRLCFSAEQAKEVSERGEKVILIRQETSPEDIEGMVISEAIITSRGGMTSHAAVVARGMGVCCVVGAEALYVDEHTETVSLGEQTLPQGTLVSVDGTTGHIYLGEIALAEGEDWQLIKTITQWAQEVTVLGVKANAETAKDIQTALKLGAQGIGLARTEHMFFGEERIFHMRKLILAEEQTEIDASLESLKMFQKEDFREIFTLLQGKACTIRLLDPPLHEFLPQKSTDIVELAEEMMASVEEVNRRIDDLSEQNPMLGHRGCRLAVTTPEIYEMQVAAIIESAIEVSYEKPTWTIIPEIMIPLIGSQEEMRWLKARLKAKIQMIFEEKKASIDYKIGTMLEIPRACLTADKLAEVADFFSFGTNDLTQLTYGFSRDDSVKFMSAYQENQLLASDPFQQLDEQGVGELMRLAVEKIKTVDSSLPIGVCGEIGGDPQSIRFLKKIGVDYISCSPYRIPATLLTIAQLSAEETWMKTNVG